MEGGQGLTEVRSILTVVLKCTFEAIWHPDCHQNAPLQAEVTSKTSTGKSVPILINILPVH